MKEVLECMTGWKTHTVGAVVCLLVFGSWQGWWHVPVEAYAGLLALALMCLRSGVKKEIGGLLDGLEEETPKNQNPDSTEGNEG